MQNARFFSIPLSAWHAAVTLYFVTAETTSSLLEMRAASPPRSRSGVGCAAPLLLLATWLGECTAGAVPPGWDITVSGGCSWATGSSGPRTYTYQGTTDSGAPYYKAEGASCWLYWDPDCDGSGGSSRPARWIFDPDDNAPSTNASSDLDGDNICQFHSCSALACEATRTI